MDEENVLIDVVDTGNGCFTYIQPDSDVLVDVIFENEVSEEHLFAAEIQNNTLLLWNAPADVMIFVVGYRDGLVVDSAVLEASAEIPIDVEGETVRIFFLQVGTYVPLLDKLEMDV